MINPQKIALIVIGTHFGLIMQTGPGREAIARYTGGFLPYGCWVWSYYLSFLYVVSANSLKPPKKKTKPKENFKNSQKNQEVVVQREPKVIHQKRPEYSSYREPVEVTRYENPNPRYELPKEQFDKYEYEEPRANSNQVYVIEEPIQVNHGQSRFVEERMSYNPNRDSRVIEGSNMQYSDSYAGYNPYNLY